MEKSKQKQWGRATRADLCDALDGASDGEDSLVDAGDDFGDAGLHAGVVSDVCHILACLSDDDPRVLCRDESAEREGVVRVLWGGRRRACGRACAV